MKAVALHDARKTLALGHTGHVHTLAGREAVNVEFSTGLQIRVIGVAQAELKQRAPGSDIRLGVVLDSPAKVWVSLGSAKLEIK